MRTDFSAVFGVAAEFQLRRAGISLIGGNGDDRQFVLPIGQRETETERTIGTKIDDTTADGDLGAGLRRTVNDQFGVDVEPESLLSFHAAERTGDAGASAH